jgi:lipopolysaccharide/colanic/teichoic acid biosynthesis glycosyltransferase
MLDVKDIDMSEAHNLRLDVRPASAMDDLSKRSFDLAFVAFVGIAALPTIALLWLAVRLTSSGPGFYSQTRVGRNSRPYQIYKLRTMHDDCERSTGARWCVTGDPRVTPLGRVLRKLHLDELPQLWNVLRGEMSLVGPRPERPEFVGPLSVEIPDYSQRHRVRPGVTGLAQIQLPADTSVDSVRRKTVLDCKYVADRTLWLDVRIVVGTIIYITGCSYDTVRRLMRLPNPLWHGSELAIVPAFSAPDDACVELEERRAAKSTDDSTVCGKV